MSYYGNELLDRAVTSYFRRHGRIGSVHIDQPARDMCVEHRGKVTIANNYRILGQARITGEPGSERFLWCELDQTRAEREFESFRKLI